MSFKQIPSVSTALSELGWLPYPIDDGNVVYSYDEFYMYIYLQHSLNHSSKDGYYEGSGTSPVALLTNVNEWYIPSAPLFFKLGIIEEYSESVFTYTDSGVEKIFSNFVNYMKTVIPEKFKEHLNIFSVLVWLNDMQYSDSIPKLVLDDNGMLKSLDEIFKSISIINLFKLKPEIGDYCYEALKYNNISEYFLNKIFDFTSSQNLTVKTYVEEFNDFYNAHMINSTNWVVKTIVLKENGFQIRNVGFEYSIINKLSGEVFATAVALPSKIYNPRRVHDLQWTVKKESMLNSSGLLDVNPESIYTTYAVYNCLRLMNAYVNNLVPCSVKVDEVLFNKIFNNNLTYEHAMLFA